MSDEQRPELTDAMLHEAMRHVRDTKPQPLVYHAPFYSYEGWLRLTGHITFEHQPGDLFSEDRAEANK